jgi:heat shock protein HtpX
MDNLKTNFYSEIRTNNFKTYILFLCFFIFIGLVGFALQYIFSDFGVGILFIAGVFAIVYALVGYYAGDKIVLATSRAKLIEPDKNSKHKFLDNLVEGLSIASGIPKPKVYIIQDKSPNAFATGRSPKHSSIAVTSGILEILNREELEGVVAHELSHIRNRDIKVMTIATVLFGLIMMVSDIAFRGILFGGASGGNNNNKNPVILIIAIIFVVLSPIIAMMIKMSISRKREFLADASGAKITRYPQGLANALKKISGVNIPVSGASKGTAHLYIINPFRGNRLSKMFSTHPPIEERIKKLESM